MFSIYTTRDMADSKEQKLDFTLKELSLSSQSEDVPGSSSTVPLRSHRFVCVEYPAVVTDVDRVLETLGGEGNLSKVRTQRREILCSEILHQPSQMGLFIYDKSHKA